MLYSLDEIRAYTIGIIIGLLWSTRLRPSEPTKLTVADVDLSQNLLHIRETKFLKERLVSIDETVAGKLLNYKLWISNKLGSNHPTDAFFYTTGGISLKESALVHPVQGYYYRFHFIQPLFFSKIKFNVI